MTTAPKFDPMKEVANVRDQINRVLEDTFSSSSTFPLDMYETDDAIVIETAPLYGLKSDTLDIEIVDGQMTISGEREDPTEVAPTQYIRRERKFGIFSRTITIPDRVVAEEAKAKVKNHILTVTIPKQPEANPKVIKVTPVE